MEMQTQNVANSPEIGLGGFEYYGLQDYRRMLWRRRWTIVSTTLILALTTAVVAYFIPNVYRASTVVLVEPRKVPDNLVSSTATSAVDRLSNLREQILSNTRLSQIIDEMGLYPEMKKHSPQEEIIKQMLKDTEVEVIASTTGNHTLNAFRISYSSKSPQAAAQVANRLASLFIVENMRQREQQVLGTAEFMDRELKDLKKDLDEKDAKVQAVKSRYIAELPESEAVHERALSALETELRADMDAMNRGAQQKSYLQTILATTPPVVNLDNSTGSDDAGALETQLASLQADRDQMLSHYGPEHPDVRKKNAEIETVQKKLDEVNKASGKKAPTTHSRNPVVEGQIAALDAEMQRMAQHEKEVKEQIAFHESKLQRAPALSQELAAVESQADAARDQYKKLQERKFTADMSQDMEARQQGERFVVLEPALPPEKPAEPNRPLINGIGFAAAFIIGILVAFALEVMDSTVKTQREVTTQLPVPIFGEIPWLPTQAGTRRLRMRSLMAAAANGTLALLFLAIVYITS